MCHEVVELTCAGERVVLDMLFENNWLIWIYHEQLVDMENNWLIWRTTG